MQRQDNDVKREGWEVKKGVFPAHNYEKEVSLPKNQFGLIGLAVMGQNLVLNAADHGFSVSVYNCTVAKTNEFMTGEARGKNITAAYTLEEFVSSLTCPRIMQIMVTDRRYC